MRLQLHAIAAGVGLTYELLTGDLSQVNYSSIRAGLMEFRRRMEALQWQLLVPGLCQPVWRRFVLAAQAIGAAARRDIEARLDRAAVRGGRSDEGHPGRHPGGARRADDAEGGDRPPGLRAGPVLAEIGAINAELDALGIVLDTDPRKATKTGAAKPETDDRPEA